VLTSYLCKLFLKMYAEIVITFGMESVRLFRFMFVMVGHGTEILHADLACSAAPVRRLTQARKHILN
jgi:hypothetical protein